MSKAIIEIQTNEQSRRLKWMPIFSSSGNNAESVAMRWAEKLIAGFKGGRDKPLIRIVDADGKWLGDWGGDCDDH